MQKAEILAATERLRTAMAEADDMPVHMRLRPTDWSNANDEEWKLRDRRAEVVDHLYTASRSFTLGRRDLVADEMRKAVQKIVNAASGLGVDVLGDVVRKLPDAMWDEVQDRPSLADEVASVLSKLDELAEVWGDEGVFRRCRDRLRAALANP